MDFPPSLNFLSLRERLHDAWLLLWPLLFLTDEEGSGLSLDRGSVDDNDDDEGEGEGDGLFLLFFLLESPLLLLASCRVEGTDIRFFLGGVGCSVNKSFMRDSRKILVVLGYEIPCSLHPKAYLGP